MILRQLRLNRRDDSVEQIPEIERHSRFFERTAAGVDPSKLTQQHIRDAVKLAKDEGVDVTRWLRARMLITTLASVAEARHPNAHQVRRFALR